MIRKALTAMVAVTALLLSLFAFSSTDAEANTVTCPYELATASDEVLDFFGLLGCADALAYPGPFSNHPPAPTGPYGWGSLNITAGAVDHGDAGTGGGAAPLAHTGSETASFVYVGAGLVAFGAVALGSRRKIFQGALD